MDLNTLKQLIVRTPFQKLSMDLKARIELSEFSKINDRITGNSTVYCISPYKTGTRYINGSYNEKVSAHEALHYLSLKTFEKDFNDFFIRRLNTLNLKLECSGFLSAYVDELASCTVAKNLHYIVVTRPPSSWITSAVNYWDYVNRRMKMYYHYTNILYWKKKVGVDLDTILSASKKEQNTGLKNMSEFYLSYTRKTKKLKNVYYVDINEIDAFLPTLDQLINETSNPKKKNIGAFNKKTFFYKNEKLDEEYRKLIIELKNN